GIRIAVNISPLQLEHPDFLQRFFDLTQPWADPTCGLDVEITEGTLLGDSSAALNRLSELPIDTLKIDRSFISRLPDDRSGRTLVSTIISLARAFNMTVVAEG